MLMLRTWELCLAYECGRNAVRRPGITRSYPLLLVLRAILSVFCFALDAITRLGILPIQASLKNTTRIAGRVGI